MSSYVTRERIAIEITLSNGAPTELSLEIIFDGTSTTYVLGTDSEIVDAGSGVYRYSFVPTDAQKGIYQYRWYGKDSADLEFALPDDSFTGYESFSVFNEA